MLLPCRFYTANARLFAGVLAFSREPGFWCCCLKGSMVVNKGVYKATTPSVTVLVNCLSLGDKKPVMAVLTTDPEYQKYDGGKIETDTIPTPSMYMSLCTLLKEKYSNTLNPFVLSFTCDGSTADVSADIIGDSICLKATLKIPTGEAILTGDSAISSYLRDARGIKSFQYTAINPAVEKEVTVRKCYGEILREIAHYLNRTLVLISQTQRHLIVEQYISAVGCAEVTTREDGVKVYKKVSASTLQDCNVLGVYTANSTVDEILREYGKALKKQG